MVLLPVQHLLKMTFYYEADFMTLHYDLDTLKEKYKNKNKEYLDKLAEHNVMFGK